MYKIILSLALLCFVSCVEKKKDNSNDNAKLNALAGQYVRLGLSIGQYDKDFVDAYYGPDSLQPVPVAATVFPKDSFLKAVNELSASLKTFDGNPTDTIVKRAVWLRSQLKAFERRIKLVGGDSASFDDECRELYGVTAPVYDSVHFKNIIRSLDSLLPGKGTVNGRMQLLANRFIIPKEKLDTVLKTAIAECRKLTLQHYSLPAGENFSLEFVNNKPWSGYNWYKGNYRSVIQINTDLKIFIDRAIDVGSHESYPGHHVYNMLLEKNLYRNRGWVEASLYPLYSPQSLIAEGSANYGIALVFPGEEKAKFAKEHLLPLAGLDTAGISLYFKALELKEQLNYARNEVGRGLLGGGMNEQQAMYWLTNFCLMNDETAKKSISFIRSNRGYIINYNYGKDLVKEYIVSKAGTADRNKQWEAFGWLLSNPVIPSDLKK